MVDKEKSEQQEKVDETIQEETVETTEEKVDEVETADESSVLIKELEQEVADLEDRNLRLQAEMQNVMKRNQREREQLQKYRSQDLAEAILPVMDNLNRALEIEVVDEAGQALKDGIEMVQNGFISALESQGVTRMNSLHQTFDPNYHEAYTMVEPADGQESGVVAEVFEEGYMIGDRILRAAKVAVTI